VVSFTPQPLYPWGKSPQYLAYLRGGGVGLVSRSGRNGEEKYLAHNIIFQHHIALIWEKREMHIGYWWGSQKERDH
jgi:hypothetical protein